MLYSAAVISFAVAIFVMPRDEFSPEENRMLAEPPRLTAESLINGDFAKDVSEYCADSFPFRTALLRLNSAYSLSLGRLENSGVMKGKNQNLIKRSELYDNEKLATALAAVEEIKKFAENRGCPTVFLCPPRAVDVLTDYSPLPLSPDTELWQRIEDENALCVTDLLKDKANEGEYVFYRTDHHWTTLGAYYAYTVLGNALGYEPYPISAFTAEEVCNNFFGSSYSASLMPNTAPDSITAMRYECDTAIKVTDVNTGEVFGLYDADALDGVSKYNFFLGGNRAHLFIENGEKEEILVIKDSFANSLVPFLSRHYNVTLIDPRYLRTPLDELVADLYSTKEISALIIICNPETLYTESGLKNFPIFHQSP